MHSRLVKILSIYDPLSVVVVIEVGKVEERPY
jgi:hypothetical protein